MDDDNNKNCGVPVLMVIIVIILIILFNIALYMDRNGDNNNKDHSKSL